MTAREKIEELYTLYEKPMYYIALAVLNDHYQAEDAVSESFLKIIEHLDKLNEPDDPRTKQYIIKIIKSVAISKYRKNASEQKRVLPLDESATAPDSFEDIFEEDKEALVLELLSPLNDVDFEIVTLRGYEDLAYKEISQRLELSESTVRKRYERARKKILQHYEERNNLYE